jgi:hypothetical protein
MKNKNIYFGILLLICLKNYKEIKIGLANLKYKRQPYWLPFFNFSMNQNIIGIRMDEVLN